MQRERAQDSEPERDAKRPAPAPEHAVLALQRSAGNQAVGRILARKPKHTGLRDDAVVARYVAKAVAFAARNPGAPLSQYASYLWAAVNVELGALGIPDVQLTIAKEADVGGAAAFHAEGWYMVLSPQEFSHTGAKTIGELTELDASLIAGRVIHEARHAEQHFRVARLQAGEHKDPAEAVDDDVAKVAAQDPLTGGSQEANEARRWRENEIGEDGRYRATVTRWSHEAHEAVMRLTTIEDPIRTRAFLVSQIRAWDRPDDAASVVADHLASAQRRKRTEMIADIRALGTAMTGVRDALAALPETPKATDFAPLHDALGGLTRTATHAYVDQPVEDDAYDVDTAAVNAYERAAAP